MNNFPSIYFHFSEVRIGFNRACRDEQEIAIKISDPDVYVTILEAFTFALEVLWIQYWVWNRLPPSPLGYRSKARSTLEPARVHGAGTVSKLEIGCK